MRLTRLELRDFLSHEETDLSLEGLSSLVVVGPNGAGKTSVIDGVRWALYGQGSRGSSPDAYVRSGATVGRATVEFELGGGHYRVTRERSLGRNAQSDLRLEGRATESIQSWQEEEPIREILGPWAPLSGGHIAKVQEAIEDLLGMGPDLWEATALIGQGKADQFTALRPAARKELLGELLELGAWATLHEKARSGLRDSVSRAQGLSGQLEPLTTEAAQLGAHESHAADLSRLLDEARARALEGEALLEEGRRLLEEAQEEARVAEAAAVRLGDLQRARELQGAQAEAAASAWQGSVNDWAQEIERLGSSLTERAAAVAAAVCPTCGQPLPEDQQEALVEAYSVEEARLVEAHRRHESAMADQEQHQREYERLRDPTPEERQAAELVERTEDLRANAVEARVALKRAESGHRLALDAVAKIERDLGGAEEAVRRAQAAADQATKIRAQLEEEEQLSRDLQLLSDAFGRDGIPALLIETAVPAIEREANDLLGRLMDGRLSLEIRLERALKGGGLRETLDIIVSDASDERPLEALSGGERQAVDLALRVALARTLSQRAGRPFETLIIDEGFTAFDTGARQRAVSVISTLLREFPLVVMVTHLEELAEAFPARLVVDRDGGASRTRLEGAVP